MNVDIDLTPFTKVNSTWIINLNAKCKTMKLLEDNIGERWHWIWSAILDTTTRAPFMKEMPDKLDFFQIKNFCSAKDTVIWKDKPWARSKNVQKTHLITGLLSKIYREHLKLNSNKTNNLNKKWTKDLNRYFTKEDI